ncbi:Acyltransferase sidL [Paramyrothecium foliicola]|nr:Acyltransferase sidL [Paramyrothecium foliicola]
MAPQIIHLPDGQTFTVTPIFAGVGFRSHELNTHSHAYPVGWTVVLNTEEDDVEDGIDGDGVNGADDSHTRPFRQPTLQNDGLFISSIANPSSSEFKPAASPTRQIAMMMWVTLYWYFHQPAPSPYLSTAASKATPEKARPRGEWKIKIRRQGVLAGRYIIPKLERMGLIASADTAVGCREDPSDGWENMFVSRRMFWQIPARLFLFTLQPTKTNSSVPGSPIGSRPQSPVRGEEPRLHYLQNSSQSLNLPMHSHNGSDHSGAATPNFVSSSNFPLGPFFSTSHLPTYYPPAPLQYTFTNGIRHPLRPKPHRMGEVIYSRFVPSVGQYLSFRVASSSPKPVPHVGPSSQTEFEHGNVCNMSDTALMEKWLSNDRVKAFWGEYTPNFLKDALSSHHSFPAIGLWDGVPFGYFEIYWVKEDNLGKQLSHDAGDWDRGLHILIGEEWARGRVQAWLSSLVHWCFCADFRTMKVCLEPRVDNER